MHGQAARGLRAFIGAFDSGELDVEALREFDSQTGS